MASFSYLQTLHLYPSVLYQIYVIFFLIINTDIYVNTIILQTYVCVFLQT